MASHGIETANSIQNITAPKRLITFRFLLVWLKFSQLFLFPSFPPLSDFRSCSDSHRHLHIYTLTHFLYHQFIVSRSIFPVFHLYPQLTTLFTIVQFTVHAELLYRILIASSIFFFLAKNTFSNQFTLFHSILLGNNEIEKVSEKTLNQTSNISTKYPDEITLDWSTEINDRTCARLAFIQNNNELITRILTENDDLNDVPNGSDTVKEATICRQHNKH